MKDFKFKDEELLPPGETSSSKTVLNHDIFIFVEPETKEIETVISVGGLVNAEYDTEARAWVALAEEDTWRVRDMFNRLTRYKVDWNNEEDFDEELTSITLKKYADGNLDEAHLKKNTILANTGPLED
jgi:hypothetical protein